MDTTDNSISQVREGMTVVDSVGEEVGTVKEVRMSDPGAVTPAGQERPGGLFEALRHALGASGLPDQAREDLARKGYIQIDARGPFAGSRYVAADQIAGVSDDTVTLTVPEENLLR